MQPDSLETRVGRLEQAVARMSQQLEDQGNAIKSLAPIAVAFGRVEFIIDRLQEDERETRRLVEALHKRMDDDEKRRKERQDERDKEERERRDDRDKEDRGRRLILWGIAISASTSIVAAVIGAVTVITS